MVVISHGRKSPLRHTKRSNIPVHLLCSHPGAAALDRIAKPGKVLLEGNSEEEKQEQLTAETMSCYLFWHLTGYSSPLNNNAER
jgi:hypothetical protein